MTRGGGKGVPDEDHVMQRLDVVRHRNLTPSVRHRACPSAGRSPATVSPTLGCSLRKRPEVVKDRLAKICPSCCEHGGAATMRDGTSESGESERGVRLQCATRRPSPPRLWDGTAKLGGRFDPLLDHRLGVGDCLLVGRPICGTPREFRHLSDEGLIVIAPIDGDLISNHFFAPSHEDVVASADSLDKAKNLACIRYASLIPARMSTGEARLALRP